jgi:hypothetical protein
MLTTELRNRFDMSFHKIISHLAPALREKWDGKIEWHDNKLYPTIEQAIIKQLPVGAHAAYVSLLNKLSRGDI